LQIELNSERQARAVLEDVKRADASVTANSLLSYLDYLFNRRRDIDPGRFVTVANLFYDKQYEILTALEHKVETL